MPLSDADRLLLNTLLLFLRESFAGASVGNLKIDDAADALERVLRG